VRNVIVWMATLLFVAAIVPVAVGDWSRETTLALSAVGRAIVAIAVVVAWAVTAYLYSRASSSRSGLAQLISLRQRAHSAWLLRGAIMSTSTAAIFGALVCFYAFGLVPHLPGEQVEREGIVQRVIRTGAGSRWCTNFVVVRLAADSDAKICTEEGGAGRVRPEAAALKQGDRVTVMVRRTFLGVSADLIAATNNTWIDRATADASTS
jgi:voltage-gated potassium channel Kch